MIKRRAAGIVAALVLALIGTIVLVNYVQDADERASSDEQMVNVLVVEDDIPLGTSVVDFGSRVALQEVPTRLRANGAVATLDGLAGRVAAVDLLPGEQVVAGRLITPQAAEALNIPPELHRVTVALDATRVVGGEVRAGDRVAILTTVGDQTHILLHKALVATVRTAGDGVRLTSTAGSTSPVGTLQVTFALDAPSVERVVYTAEHGSLWLSLEPAEAPEDGTKIVTSENIYQP